MDGGVFHDAHEVYARRTQTGTWTWLATFATKDMADAYTWSTFVPADAETEVRPV